MSAVSRVVLLSPDSGLSVLLAESLRPAVEVVHVSDENDLGGLATALDVAAVALDAGLPWQRLAAVASRLAPQLGGRPVLLVQPAGKGTVEARQLQPLDGGGAAVGPRLPDLLAALAGQDVAARTAASLRERSTSEFLSRMSHELRTPLNAILGFAQILEMDELSADQRDCVEHILRGGRVLLAMINEILDITRLETGRTNLDLQPFELVSALVEAADEAAPRAVSRGIAVSVEAGGSACNKAMGDAGRTRQVLRRLVDNAVAYNRDGGTVVLSCRPVPGERLRVEVADSGPGIAEELLPRLFTPFDRLDAKRSGVEGTGLGLTLCKRLVEAMGGTIGVESVPGQGSTFWFELPGITEGTEPSGDGAAPPRPVVKKPLSIVYIEDQEANAELLRRLLAGREGVTFSHAVAGREGLALIREHLPDILLLDLNLPDIAGEEILEELRAVPSTASIPVVVISADATPARLEQLRALGVQDYLTKPLEVQRFFAVLSSLLGERWSQE